MAPLETSRRLRKKNNTHKALLHAAKKLFEEKGLGNVTIDEISEAAADLHPYERTTPPIIESEFLQSNNRGSEKYRVLSL